ncbi:protein phosphatase 1 regulatory subunit 42 [Stieleria sp. ICT_E10.1]|uniref:leucine-rich repeat domain-containing protein n=1 Tax=Stieleria sedimenti TaxID=2976331 RepID=UPI00217FB25D|nr:leucine-rich repeat domain-containing protein [Stieleria sedimenti]MCS7467399.1 protein phosphatase 1 regulatory subunit 42 [Stieleria sedimenti]
MKRIRFSIRTLLLLAVVAAVGIVVYQRHARVHSTVTRFESLGGKVKYRASFLDGLHARTGYFWATPIEVDLSHSRIRRGGLVGIEHLESLERLYLNRTGIAVDDVAELVKCKRLKRLSLWGNYNITSGAIDHLTTCPMLEALDLHDTRIVPSTLGRLSDLPCLSRLVFSAEFYHQESSRMNGSVMRQLASIGQLQPVGSCFLWDFDADEIQMFCQTDTSRMGRLLLRQCELTDQACRAISSLRAGELDLQLCDLDDRRLQLIDPKPFGRIDIANRKDTARPDITLDGITAWLPMGLRTVGVYDGYVEFIDEPSTRWKYRLTIRSRPLRRALLHKWLDLGLKELDLNVDENLARDLEIVAAINPPIDLLIRNHLFVWPFLSQMDQLQGLTLYNDVSTPLRFVDGLSLRSLSLYGRFYPNKGTFQEIAKLKELSWLQIRNRNVVTLEDVQPLGALQHLTTVRISKLTPEAEAYLERLCAANETAVSGSVDGP